MSQSGEVALGRWAVTGLLLIGAIGCSVDLDMSTFTAPSQLVVALELLEPFDELSLEWRGRRLADLDRGNYMLVIPEEGWIDEIEGSRVLSRPVVAGEVLFLHDVPNLHGGALWRIEVAYEANGERVTVVCDQEIDYSTRTDAPVRVELQFNRFGCTSEAGLVAAATVTDFSGLATGEMPSDWTELGRDDLSDWTVESGSGLGGQQLEGQQAADDRRMIAWRSAGEQQDVELLVKALTHELDSQPPIKMSPAVFVRASFDDLNRFNAYFAGLVSGSRGALRRVADGVESGDLEQQFPIGYLAGQWVWMRVRIEDTSFSATVWSDGTAEPTATLSQFSDPATTVTGAGRVGVMTDTAAADPHVDFVSVSLAGTHALPPLELTCPDQPPPYYMCVSGAP